MISLKLIPKEPQETYEGSHFFLSAALRGNSGQLRMLAKRGAMDALRSRHVGDRRHVGTGVPTDACHRRVKHSGHGAHASRYQAVVPSVELVKPNAASERLRCALEDVAVITGISEILKCCGPS